MTNDDPRARAPQRIEWCVLGLTLIAAAASLARYPWQVASGIIIGGVIAWLNFRWMRSSVSGAVQRLTDTQQSTGSTAMLTLKFLARYAVLGAVVYATLKSSVANGLGVCAGLLLIVPALMIEAFYEFVLSRQRDTQVS
jgi:hypothetical protein